MSLQFNIIPFYAPHKPVSLAFFKQKVDKTFMPLTKSEFPTELWNKHKVELQDLKNLYCNFSNQQEADFVVDVDLNSSSRFALHYFRNLIRNYFLSQEKLIVSSNKINDIEVYLPAKEQSCDKYIEYYCFTIKLQCCRVSQYFELVISFDGTTRSYYQPITQLTNIDKTIISNVVVGNIIYHLKHDADIVNYSLDNAYPIISNPLRRQLGLEVVSHKPDNKYTNTQKLIYGFCKKYIFSDEFDNVLHLVKKDFFIVPQNLIGKLPDDANKLQFRNNQQKIVDDTDTINFSRTGPFQIAQPSEMALKVIFVYQKESGKAARDFVCNAFQDGAIDFTTEYGATYKRIKSMSMAIRQPFSVDDDIVFSNLDNALNEIETQLNQRQFDIKTTKYLAIYISPINKERTEDIHYQIVYAGIKELLIEKGVTIQGFYQENISKKNELPYYFTNIYSAILAKIGGIPWQLKSANPDNLIIGVGAFYSRKKGKRYIGSAFSFNGNGVFSEFTCSHESDRKMLISDIRKAVKLYLQHNDGKKPKMIVIHFYKELSKDDWMPILKMLNEITATVPIIVATIYKTETKDVVAFDNTVKDRMPLSGTYINVDKQTFLLYNNSKYNQADFDKKKRKVFHFPIKIRLDSRNSKALDNDAIVKEVLQQVYQLSRMYWKSVDQQNIPITVKYPELIAEVVPFFKNDVIPNQQFGCHNLWFL